MIMKGSLEAAGLGEVAHFLRKARQQIDYAEFALEHVDFERTTEMLTDAKEKIARIDGLILDLRASLDLAEQAAIAQAESHEELAQTEQIVDPEA